ncbi:MAG: hypothetical protein J6A63_07875 [Clostridia bacterium]|nr:hypothetical protein [Clostridia bacterium]
MTKKTKLLLTSFATIAMSASLMVGGTYALFTSETQVNVGVQAGTVEIKATVADNVLTKSRVGWGEWSATPVTTGTTIFSAFENGGGATFTENSVNLELMTPGDQVQFTIDLDNKSNVNAMYRTVVLPTEDTGLLKGLEITFADVTTTEAEKAEKETFIGAAVADWAQLPENTSDVERKILVTITLPKDAGNEYQNKTAKLVYYVEAIQGNADVNDGNVVDAQGYTLIQSATDLWRLSAQYANPNKVSVLSTTQALPKYRLAANIDLNGAPFMPIGTESNPFLGEFDGNGYTVSNFTVTGNESVGLFGYADGGNQKLTVKNLTVKDATINGSHWVGGIVGKLSGSLENCTVENVTVTAVPLNNMNGDKVGGIVGWTSRGEVKGCIAKNVTVAGYRDVGGLVGAAVADNWVKVTGNTVDGATLSFVEGYQAFDEKGVYEEQKNIAPVVGRIVGSAVVENNVVTSATDGENVYVGSAEAIKNAIASGETELLLGGDAIITEDVEIPQDVEITIDMAGNTMKFEGGKALKNSGNLTLENASIVSTTVSANIYPVQNAGGTLTINGGEFVSGSHGVVSATSGTVTVNGGTFAIAGNKGNITSHAFWASGDAVINIYDATVEKGEDYKRESGEVFYGSGNGMINVYGGTYEYFLYGDFGPWYCNTPDNVNIYGGTFYDLDGLSNWMKAGFDGAIADGYQYVENADGSFSVKISKWDDVLANATVNADGAKEIALPAGELTLPKGSMNNAKVVFSGTKDTVVDLATKPLGNGDINGADLTFDGVTVKFGTSLYKGLQHAGKVVYKNCKIIGLQFLYADSVEFVNCEFDANGAEHCVWTYGAKNIAFTDCTFNYNDRGLNLYCESGNKQTVTFTRCTFNTTNTNSQGAVEINSSTFSDGIYATLTDCVAPAYGEMAYVSPWDKTNGVKTHITVN